MVDEAQAADAPAAPAEPDMPNMAPHDGYHDYARVDLSHLTKEERKARNSAIKAERYEKRRAYQKDQSKLRKLRAKEERAQANRVLEEAGTLVRKTPAEFEAMREARKVKNALESERRWQLCGAHFATIIDCAWEGAHTKERAFKSLTQQLMYCHGLNRRHPLPSEVFIMGVGDELAPRMSTVMQKGWTCAHLLRNTYQGCLVSMGEAEEREGEKERAAAERGLAKGQDAVRVAQRRLAGRPTYYLTADCDDVLTKVDPNAVYIIGGIIDRNSMKGATKAKADTDGIATRRLPIAEHGNMNACHVLTVLHVFEILLKVGALQLADQTPEAWTRVLAEVLPKRKQGSVGDDDDDDDADADAGGGGDDEDDDDEEDGDGDGGVQEETKAKRGKEEGGEPPCKQSRQ